MELQQLRLVPNRSEVQKSKFVENDVQMLTSVVML